MTREEMVEFAISLEPGNPRLQQWVNRELYENDNQQMINVLMALQNLLTMDAQ